jgi:hypothetical protein
MYVLKPGVKKCDLPINRIVLILYNNRCYYVDSHCEYVYNSSCRRNEVEL